MRIFFPPHRERKLKFREVKKVPKAPCSKCLSWGSVGPGCLLEGQEMAVGTPGRDSGGTRLVLHPEPHPHTRWVAASG